MTFCNPDCYGCRLGLIPTKTGSPLRRYLRAEKAAANAQAYPEVCRAWERSLESRAAYLASWGPNPYPIRAEDCDRDHEHPLDQGTYSNRPSDALSVNGLKRMRDWLARKC